MKDIVLILSSVIMASGLVALVDDYIKRRWHEESRRLMTVPMLTKPPLRLGPKRLMDGVFDRKERPHRPTLLREMTC